MNTAKFIRQKYKIALNGELLIPKTLAINAVSIIPPTITATNTTVNIKFITNNNPMAKRKTNGLNQRSTLCERNANPFAAKGLRKKLLKCFKF